MAKLKGSFGVKVASGSAAGFSNIPGASSYTVSLGKQFAKKFGQGVKSVGGPKPKPAKDEPVAITDPPKDKPNPPKPKKDKGRNATTADVERAVAGGFITPEEATGGEWGKDMGLSPTYSRKYAANAAEHGGQAKGKKFTGPKSQQFSDSAPDTSVGTPKPTKNKIVDTPNGPAVDLTGY
jgi:hypothetical protein